MPKTVTRSVSLRRSFSFVYNVPSPTTQIHPPTCRSVRVEIVREHPLDIETSASSRSKAASRRKEEHLRQRERWTSASGRAPASIQGWRWRSLREPTLMSSFREVPCRTLRGLFLKVFCTFRGDVFDLSGLGARCTSFDVPDLWIRTRGKGNGRGLMHDGIQYRSEACDANDEAKTMTLSRETWIRPTVPLASAPCVYGSMLRGECERLALNVW